MLGRQINELVTELSQAHVMDSIKNERPSSLNLKSSLTSIESSNSKISSAVGMYGSSSFKIKFTDFRISLIFTRVFSCSILSFIFLLLWGLL